MRVEHSDGGRAKVWLTKREYDRLKSRAEGAQKVAVMLGAECGLRHAESVAARPADLTEAMVDLSNNSLLTDDVDGGEQIIHWLEVHGKDTTGGSKRRDAFVPGEVARELELQKHREDLTPTDPYIEVKARQVRRWISDLGERMADETGNHDWQHLSSHDLRRYFATYCLQVAGMNPEVVMEVGGWSSYGALRPYLQSPVQEVIAAEFAAADML